MKLVKKILYKQYTLDIEDIKKILKLSKEYDDIKIYIQMYTHEWGTAQGFSICFYNKE